MAESAAGRARQSQAAGDAARCPSKGLANQELSLQPPAGQGAPGGAQWGTPQ